jgi:Cu/Ag efflux protein CusF
MPRTALLSPACALALGVFLTACAGGGGKAQPGAAASEAAAPRKVATYEGRGEVTGLPDPNDPSTSLTLRHEAIDDFTDIDGDVVGMDPMTMPFPLADGVSLAGLAPGDKVSFTLEVEWEGDPPYRIVRIDKLPPETPLDFRAARPGGS